MNTIVDVSLSSSAYSFPTAGDLTNVETALVIAFLAALMLLIGLLIVWTFLSKVIYRVVFGILYLVGLITAWILSGIVVSILIFYIKPSP